MLNFSYTEIDILVVVPIHSLNNTIFQSLRKTSVFLEDRGGRLKIRDSLAGRPYKTHCWKDQPSIMEEQAAEKRFST